MSQRWQDEVSSDQWDQWMKTATKIARRWRKTAVKDSSDHAAIAIEKLLKQQTCPDNVTAWLTRTIQNQYHDVWRKLNTRGSAYKEDITDAELEGELISFATRSPSMLIGIRDQVSRILDLLSSRERELLVMAAAGFDNHEIARELGYASNRVVATRIKQVSEKLEKLINEEHQSLRRTRDIPRSDN